MANHIRRQIRERIATLVGGLTTTGARVYQSRVYALATESELPCLLVYSLLDEVTKTGFCHPGEIERTITVAIEAVAVATATADLDDTLDLITKEVEIALAADPYLSNLAKDLQLTRTELQLRGADTPKPVGAARMTWTVKTSTIEGAPDVVV